jgi:putative DNA primase/helicase
MVLSNELPRLADASGALASRFIILVMSRSYYGHEDTGLTDKLLNELPGILNWALDGAERLLARGRFRMPRASADAVREMEDLGSPIGAFIRDRCVLGPTHEIVCDHLYMAWKDWCTEQGIKSAGTTQDFGRDLRAAVPGIRMVRPRGQDGRQHRTYRGIGKAESM